MKATNILIAIITALLASSLFIWYSRRQPFSKKQTPKIMIGTNAEYPPFTFIKNDQIVGFDIDITKEVFRRLKINIKIQDMSYTSLIPALQLDKIQVIAAGMTATPERAQQVIFTKPYLKNDPLLVISLAKNSPIESIDELQNKKIIVDEGYTSDMYMSKIKAIQLLRTTSPVQGFLMLKSGRAAAYVIAKSSAQPFLQKYGEQIFNIFEITDKKATESYSLAISKNRLGLAQKIQTILDEMETDGTIQELRAKWKLLW